MILPNLNLTKLLEKVQDATAEIQDLTENVIIFFEEVKSKEKKLQNQLNQQKKPRGRSWTNRKLKKLLKLKAEADAKVAELEKKDAEEAKK